MAVSWPIGIYLFGYIMGLKTILTKKTIIVFIPADDLPGVLPVAEHDGLVHDHPLGRLCLVTPGDPYDVEVRAGGKTKVRLDCIRQ